MTRLLLLLLGCAALDAQVPGYPIGRCVRVQGVTAPEDAKTMGFEYLEIGMQDVLPLDEDEFAKVVTRIRGIGLPAISGYAFMPPDVAIVGPQVNWTAVDAALARGLDRARRLGISMVVYGNLLNKARRAPEGYDARKDLIEFGRRAAKAGREREITVLMEPLPASSTNTITSVAEGLALVEAVNDPYFQLMVDFGYVTNGKEDLAVIQRAAKHIRQVEIQNPNGRVYPKLAEEAGYEAFFRALKAGGYRGGFSIHGTPKDVFVDAPVAIRMLRGELSRVQ